MGCGLPPTKTSRGLAGASKGTSERGWAHLRARQRTLQMAGAGRCTGYTAA